LNVKDVNVDVKDGNGVTTTKTMVQPNFFGPAQNYDDTAKKMVDSTTHKSMSMEINLYKNEEYWTEALKFNNFWPQELRDLALKELEGDIRERFKGKLPSQADEDREVKIAMEKDLVGNLQKHLNSKGFKEKHKTEIDELINPKEPLCIQVYVKFPNTMETNLLKVVNAPQYPHDEQGTISADLLMIQIVGGKLSPYVSKAGKEGVSLEADALWYCEPSKPKEAPKA
jgi:hypothetical protein